MPSPFSLLYLFIFITLIMLLITFIQLGLLTIAFAKLGLSATSAIVLLFSSLIGSLINLPLFSITAEAAKDEAIPRALRGLLRQQRREFTGTTIIAINVGGCLIPLCFSLYLLWHHPIAPLPLALAIAIVSMVCYLFSRPIAGLGIAMPLLIAPLAAAIVALLLYPAHSAVVAYIAGTLGVLIGADIARLKDIRQMGTPIAAIGGAGTFDGIFLTGIIAALLA